LAADARKQREWGLISFVMTRFLMMVTLLSSTLMIPALAQENTQWHHYNFNFGGGVTPMVGADASRLNTGWNFVAGGGYNFTRSLGIVGEYMVNQSGVSNRVLQQLNVPGGSGNIWSLTANPTLRINPNGRFGGYLIGGGGLYTRTVEFTRPTTAAVDFFDPWFGFGTAFVPANQVIGSVTRRAAGWNAGGGLTFGLGNMGAKLYTEARYHWADTAGRPIQIIPVTIGLRW
jgi:hypothetical protein